MQSTGTEPDALAADAVALLKAGQVTLAEARCREALARSAGHVGALTVLSVLLIEERRFGEAVDVLTELTRLEPDEKAHWLNLGNARRGARDLEGSLRAHARAAELGEASADFYYNVGLTHLERLDFESARAVLTRARALAPADAEIRFRLAVACHEVQDNAAAAEALEGWQGLEGLSTELVASIAELLVNAGEPARAESALADALTDPAPSPQASVTLIQVLERINRVGEAEAELKRLLTDPRSGTLDTDLLLVEAQLAVRAGDHETACRRYAQVLGAIADFHQRHFHLFLLGQSQDALGRHEEAYATLTEAHASQAAYLARAVPALTLRGTPTMVITRYGSDPADVADFDDTGAPPVADSPIFIVGFPRSGTTLLELTLDAHPALKAMDEQPYLQNALEDMLGAGASYPERLAGLTREQLDATRSRYWERARTRVRLAAGERLVDKNPFNVLRLAVIRRLFPHARILLTVRHPCDVILSCFMQHFRAADFALLCRTLPSLAMGLRRTFDFWYREAAMLKPVVCEVRYETLVSDFEAQVRSIAEFLQLRWDDRLLHTAEHALAKGYISTPSYAQVIEPVSARSVSRWHAYERHFTGLLPELEPYLQRWSYGRGVSVNIK
jgi:tetratricopeptide (TPR) repeat protein